MKKTAKQILLCTLCIIFCFTFTGSSLATINQTVGEKITFDVSNVKEEARIAGLAENDGTKLCLAENGTTDFRIVYPQDSSEQLLYAVEVFQDMFLKMTGCEIEAGTDMLSTNGKRKTILLDAVWDTQRPTTEQAGADGYRTVISSDSISICGVTQSGSCNGVYGFLEDLLGCIFTTPTETYIPEQKTVYLELSDFISKPATDWRDVYAYETAENNWAAKLRLNGIDTSGAKQEENIEGKQYAGWGTWCHNCYSYLSPNDYFETHPEYFSMKDGERVHTYEGIDAYLCLSNPEVYEIVKKSMAEKMEEKPEALYWDFSGNDNYSLAGCECDTCKKLDDAAGGTGMGTLLPFLNKLAREFPDKYISSLAYFHTTKAPVNIKAEPNVVIKLCSMPGDQASSYLKGNTKGAQDFKQQVEEWSKVCEHIIIWDYVVNFQNLLLPFPNFAVQADNQKFYEENNIAGVFHQASREKGGEFASLRAYILSRLMWEGSEMDVAESVSRYLAVYYGDAAPFIAEYMNNTADALYNSGEPLGLYDWLTPHYKGYLSEKRVNQYMDIFMQAEQAVAGDAVFLTRVRQAKIPVLYAKTLLPDISSKERTNALNEMIALCSQFGITEVCEWDSLENYQSKNMMEAVRSTRKTVHKGLYRTIYIACGVTGAVVAAGIITITVKKLKKKKYAEITQ